MTEDIILDPSIRDWVVLPMLLLIVLFGVVRHYANDLMKTYRIPKLEEVKNMQSVERSQRLRRNSKYISSSAFKMRKQFLVGKEGILKEKAKNTATNPMMNPEGMTEMMKGNMMNMIPNIAMMGLMSYFFAGFVLLKIPFSLTRGFKMMLQRGIELDTLDVSYVSTLSWYFLVMFGIRDLQVLLLGEESSVDEAKIMQTQMSMGMAGGTGPMGFDAPTAFKQERESLQLYNHQWDLSDIEMKYLGLNPSDKKTITRDGSKRRSRLQ